MAQIYVPTESALTHRQFKSCASSIEVLIGGQSDIKASIVPTLLHPQAFNFSDTGEGSIESYFKFRTILPEVPNIRCLVYSLSLPQFVGVRSERLYSRIYRHGYVTRDDYADLRALGVRSPARERLLARFEVTGKAELFVMRQNVINALKAKPTRGLLKGELIRGYRRQDGSHVDVERAETMVDHHFNEGGVPVDPVMVSYFERMLRLFADRGVPVVTVSPPVTDVYRKAAERHVSIDEIRAATLESPAFEGLVTRHIDMTTAFESDYEYFRDQNHMNARGAQAATEFLRAEISDLIGGRVTR